MIKQNALSAMGCAMHEKMIRDKFNQFSSFSSETMRNPSYLSPVGGTTSNEINQTTSNMNESCAQDPNTIDIPLSSIFKQKRSH